jgi:poly-beta-1,6 N-acetyl-D-glucosamine synthase
MFMLRFTIVLLAFAILQLAVFLPTSFLHYRKWKSKTNPILRWYPTVSIIVPCYNEEACIENCVDSLLQLDYPDFEILLIDDGSTDSTAALAWSLAARHGGKVRAFTKKNGGKHSALNHGLAQARGSVIINMDADSLLLPDAVTHCVATLDENPDCPAVAGNVKVVNRKGLWGRSQSIEYIFGQNYLKRAFAYMGCMQVIPGAIGAFRKSALVEIGGYSGDTLVEDMDLTIALARQGRKVIYNPHAIAYTEAPESIRQLYRQRFRWGLGGLQCMHKHRSVFGEWSRIGLIGLPIFAAWPWIYFFMGWFMVISWSIQGGLLLTLVLLGVVGICQTLLNLYALHLDREPLRQVWIVWIDMIYYSRLLSVVIIPIAAAFLMGKKGTWKQQRLGRNTMTSQPVLTPIPMRANDTASAELPTQLPTQQT